MEVIINKNDIKTIIENYKEIDSTFVIKNFIDSDKKKRCVFFIDGKECTIDIFIKTKSVNIIPIGKNVDKCKKVIEYVVSRGYEKEKFPVRSVQLKFNNEIYESLLRYIDEDMLGMITYESIDDIITKFVGYNGDEITLHFWKHKNKALIQGRPLYVYNIILIFLSTKDCYNMNEIVNLINNSTNQSISVSIVREEMKNSLGGAYYYLGEPLLKCISTSLTYLNSKIDVEDYSNCLAGIFRALEGYLIKLLREEYNYNIEKNQKFNMFYKNNGISMIDSDTSISPDEKNELNKLYKFYSDKRNVYLHSNIDTELTAIIETLNEANNLAADIISEIKVSYDIIF